MSKRVLVTGGTGFVGQQTVSALVRRGVRPIVLTSGLVSAQKTEAAQYVSCDLTDLNAVRETVQEIEADTLIHLAWRPTVGVYGAEDNLDWLHASITLIRAFVDAGGQRVVGGGTCAEYDWSAGICFEDKTPLQPGSLYGATKVALYHAVKAYCQTKDVGFAWGRGFFVYGPNEHPKRLAASVIVSLLEGEPAPCSHGMQLRDYIHVEDLGRGYAALALSEVQGAYNLGTGRAIRLAELVRGIADEIGRPDLVRLGALKAPADEPPLILADMGKVAASKLDWSAEISLEDGIAQTVAAFQKR